MASDESVRARRFDAIFEADHTYSWVLSAAGHVERANDRARESLHEGAAPEEPFWASSWWQGDDERERVRDAVETARAGDPVTCELAVETGEGDRVLAVTFWPVVDDDGTVASVVVDGRDVTDRADLEAELRESERLHRVTLDNMTDTVLITDDDGAFTYVCPNVHFIFGYTAEEIHELGTIDALLGEDVVDRTELDRTGVLTNVECTATDKAGREHALLVNARRVEIGDGTVLYSCRDVTARKEREAALTALHRITRSLLYAEMPEEIARITVDGTGDVLGLAASAVYRYDDAANELAPMQASPELEALHGPIGPVPADDDSLVGHAYVSGEDAFYADVPAADRLRHPATDLRSCAVVPLGDHGVFLAGSTDADAFDDVTRELTELLAATVAAALDRVERESRLRRQERELSRRNERLTALNRVNELIREIDQSLVAVETREEIERAVCEQLTASDRFAFAWIGADEGGEDGLEPRAWAGDEDGYLDGVDFGTEAGTEPATVAAREDRVAAVADVTDGLRDAPWRSEALSRGFRSVLSVPLAYDEVRYGVLTVYAGEPSAFDETVRAVIAELGETIASAISSVERKSALLTTARTRLTVDVTGDGFVLSRVAARAGCAVTYEGGLQQTDDGVRVFVTVRDCPAADAAAAATELVSVTEATVLGDGESGGVLRLGLSGPFLASSLADHGAVLQRVEASRSGARLTVDVPETVAAGQVVDLLANTFDGAELVSKQSMEYASVDDLHAAFRDRLTDRQLEVLQAAYYGGYFESPRDSTGEDVADALGISPAAFYGHVRTVQRELFGLLFDTAAASPPPEGAR